MGASRTKVYAANDDTKRVVVEDDAPPSKPTTGGAMRRPRRTLYRRIVRPLQRRYRQLPWTTRETVSVTITISMVTYLVLSVPLRIGFFFDPVTPSAVGPWTRELSVLSSLDLVSDAVGVWKFIKFYRVWQDAFSLLAQSVSFELGKKMAKKHRPHDDKPKISTRNRQVDSAHRGSQAQWTLATIAPAIVAASEATAAVRRRKRVELLLEVIALVPIEVVALATHRYNLLHVLRLTKLCRAHRVPACLDKLSRIYGQRHWVQTLSLTGISTLARNISLGAFLCHWFACGYMWIAHSSCGLQTQLCDPTIETSWVIKDRLLGATTIRKYGRALYWAARTMVVLGYDDATPVSNKELVYGLFVQLAGALLSTSLLATFLFIFRYRVSRQAAFNTHVDDAREYMKSQNLPRDVRHQVMAYFSYAWATHHSLDGEAPLHLLPKHLESKVVSTLKASRIKQVCFLMRESVEFINLLALRLVHRVYIPGDSIIEPKINAKMFFVLRGTVILSAFDGSRPKECQTGDFFADCCLLTPEQYEEKAVAKTFCELYVLEKAAFDDAIAHFYRGKQHQTIDRMRATFEKYATQLRKTKKLLGLRGGGDDAGPSHLSTHTTGAAATSWRLPASTFRIRWDIVRLLTTIYVAFEVPYYIVFISNHDAQRHFLVGQELGSRYAATLAIELFFMTDFVLRCRFFAYLDPVVMMTITDPTMIFAIYKRNGFYLDLAAAVPIALVMETLQGGAEDYSWLFRLFRMLRLRYVVELVQDINDFYGISSKIQLILGLLLGVTLTLHMVACLWFQMAWVTIALDDDDLRAPTRVDLARADCLDMASRFGNCSWVRFDCYGNLGVTFPIDNPASPYQTTFAYIRSIYWAVVALTGVGYGDIAAFSTAESYFAAVWIFASGILNFGIVGAMSSTISNLLASQHHHVEKLNMLNGLMEHLGIRESLRGEIRRFYHQQFKTRKNAYESQLLQHLPEQLCYRISSLLHSDATKRVALFESASREFLEDVTGKFRHRTYQNGETVCIEGDSCNEFMVLTHGKVNVFRPSQSTCPIGALVSGDCYGANEFMLKRPHAVTLVAASSIHASVMTREHFDGILRKFDEEMADMSAEAHDAWLDDRARHQKITTNFTQFKLQPHVLSTPSLFYQRELYNSRSTGGGVATALSSWISASRDVDAVRSRVNGARTLVLTCWNIYNAFTIVFRIAFHAHLADAAPTIFITLDLVCDASFVLDMYMKLYYVECDEVGLDNLVTREERSATYRASRQFKRDVLASLPLYYLRASAPLATSLCRLPRLLRCFDLWAYIDEAIILAQQTFAAKNVSAYLSPVKLLFFLLLGTHYAACIFYSISAFECAHDATHCWMAHDHILHEYHDALFALYVRCFYWALTSLTLVGSREVVSRATLGTAWATVTCLGTTFIMGFILGELSELIIDMGKDAKEYKARIDSFERFAKENGLSETLQNRVSFFFKTQRNHAEGSELDAAVHDMSANLKLKLLHEIYGASISALPISRFLTPTQVNNLSLRLKTELFIPGDDIVVEHSFGSRLCIMRTGVAAVFWSSSASSVALLMAGCLFGEIGFFLPAQRRVGTVKATTSCEILHISKHAWNELWTATSDDTHHVQQYAQHAILDWVKGRLQAYQATTLDVAKRTRRHLLQRKIMRNLEGMMARPVDRAVLKLRKSDRKRSFVKPERLVMEKKAQYLLKRANKVSEQLQRLLAEHHGAVPAMSAMSTNHDHSKRFDRPTVSKKALKTVDLSFGQFFVGVNPVNKHVVPHLDEPHLERLERECWQRFRYLVALQHTVSDMMELLVPRRRPLHHGLHPHAPPPPVDKPVAAVERRQRPSRCVYADDSVLFLASRSALTPTGPERSKRLFTPTRQPSMSRFQLKRLASKHSGRMVLSQAVPETDTAERAMRLRRMQRCRSLPHFDAKYFATVKAEDEAAVLKRFGSVNSIQSTLLARVGITFDILQRSRRTKLATLYRWYRYWRRWTGVPNDADSIRSVPRSLDEAIAPAPASKVSAASRASTRLSLAWITRASQAPLDESETSDETAVAFALLMRQLSKAWDVVMLLVAFYHAIVTPLKVCYRHDLEDLEHLRAWSGVEYGVDVVCVVDVALRIRRARTQLEQQRATRRRPQRHRLQWTLPWLARLQLPRYDGVVLDLVVVFPLELLAFALDASWSQLPYAAKWQRLAFLRLNKVLLARRIDEISESVFQYVVYDLKLPVAEASLNFYRSLASYVLMGHWMACVWFAVSEKAHELFASSWLSTPGMLGFAPGYVTTLGLPHRVLSTSASIDLDAIPLARKYLRSMHFALCSITTLWYGDIASLNLLELLVEMLCILVSIYIYGFLVGAQGELLEAHSRREALFEQNLGALQHYLIQNNVPKMLKKQIKQYYASIWRRRNGQEEFEVLAGISRALHEDVVYATLHRFAWKVAIFHALDIHFLRALLVRLQYVVCSENEEVVIRGDVDRSMYFISDGRILVKHDKSEATKETGDFFGELALLYGIPRGETCIALTISELYRLDAAPYEELLLEFPEYRAKNRAEWTTVEPPPSALSAMAQHPTTQTLSAAVQSMLGNHSATPVKEETANRGASTFLDEEVARSFVYKAAMDMLAQWGDVDSLHAKFIIANARLGARKRLKLVLGIETARGGPHEAEEATGWSDYDAGSRPVSPLSAKRSRRKSSLANAVQQFITSRRSSHEDGGDKGHLG